jgi:hypothetical protein
LGGVVVLVVTAAFCDDELQLPLLLLRHTTSPHYELQPPLARGQTL